MTNSFRTALFGVGAFAAVLVIGVLLLGTGGDDTRAIPEDVDIGRGETGPDEPAVRLEGSNGSRGDPTAPVLRPGGGGDGVMDRLPEGIDLSDPAQVKVELERAITDEPIHWATVAYLAGLMPGALEDPVRGILLRSIAQGNRVGALQVFGNVRDGTFIRAFFDLLDGGDLTPSARSAVLRAIATLPGANTAEAILGLESRLSGNAMRDAPMLQAIGERGGREAARAILDYVARSDDPRNLPGHAFLKLDLAEDEEAIAVMATALANERNPDILRKLIAISAQPGADALAKAMIDLDRQGVDDTIRREVLVNLARIGTPTAVDHLTSVSQQAGVYGELAIQNIGRITSASAEARASLLKALDTADRNPRPVDAHRELLRSLGTLRYAEAMPAMVEGLDHADGAVRQVAARGLGRLGPAAAPHLGKLLDVYSTGNESTQRTVIVSLGAIGGPDAKSALEQMRDSGTLTPMLERTVRMSLTHVKYAARDAEREGSSGAGLEGLRR